eukprot:scaffold140_cov565-Prasinococcus_capsulatus_cf.AAC.4
MAAMGSRACPMARWARGPEGGGPRRARGRAADGGESSRTWLTPALCLGSAARRVGEPLRAISALRAPAGTGEAAAQARGMRRRLMLMWLGAGWKQEERWWRWRWRWRWSAAGRRARRQLADADADVGSDGVIGLAGGFASSCPAPKSAVVACPGEGVRRPPRHGGRGGQCNARPPGARRCATAAVFCPAMPPPPQSRHGAERHST